MAKTQESQQFVRARRADARDAEVGRRVRSRRIECQISQTELADRIGVTFQQVQKYEKGINRIGAGRLQKISETLEVPISFFFGGSPQGSSTSRSGGSTESVFGYMQTSGSVRIVKAFHQISSRQAREFLVEVAEEMATLEPPDANEQTKTNVVSRVARVTSAAKETFSSDKFAQKWLALPNPALENQTPIELTRTEAGTRKVETILSRIAHGDYS